MTVRYSRCEKDPAPSIGRALAWAWALGFVVFCAWLADWRWDPITIGIAGVLSFGVVVNLAGVMRGKGL